MQQQQPAVADGLLCMVQVPLKRVNQVYVIATSTKVDIKGVDISKIDDAYFKAAEEPKKKKGEDEFFKADAEEEKKVRYVESCFSHLSREIGSLQLRLWDASGHCIATEAGFRALP